MHKRRQLHPADCPVIPFLNQSEKLIYSVNPVFRYPQLLCAGFQHSHVQFLIRTSQRQLQYKSQFCFLHIADAAHPAFKPRFFMLLADIINDSFQTIKHPLSIIITDFQIFCTAFPVKFNNTSQFYPGTDPVYLRVFRHLYPRLSSRPVNAYLYDICIAPFHKRTQGHVVDHSSVNITAAVHLLIAEADQICAGQKIVLKLPLRNI